MDCQASTDFSLTTSAKNKFGKAVFVESFTSGLQVVQLYILTYHTALTIFVLDGSQVSFASSPRILAKNEHEGHCHDPFVIGGLQMIIPTPYVQHQP